MAGSFWSAGTGGSFAVVAGQTDAEDVLRWPPAASAYVKAGLGPPGITGVRFKRWRRYDGILSRLLCTPGNRC